MGTTAYVLELHLVFMPRKLHDHEDINATVSGVCDFSCLSALFVLNYVH